MSPISASIFAGLACSIASRSCVAWGSVDRLTAPPTEVPTPEPPELRVSPLAPGSPGAPPSPLPFEPLDPPLSPEPPDSLGDLPVRLLGGATSQTRLPTRRLG